MGSTARHASAILLVEDDPDAQALAVEHLEDEGWPVRTASTGARAIEIAAATSIGLVVLDLGLPDIGGLDVLSSLRHDHPDVPVIILTADRGEPSRVRGLWSGADDYLEKPFSPRELVARIRSVLRRAGVVISDRSRLGLLAIDHGGRAVTVGDEPVVLTQVEFDVLAQLAARPGQVLSREQLVVAVWAPLGRDASDATVTEIVRRVRTKLAAVDPTPAWIENVRGVGYRFSPES